MVEKMKPKAKCKNCGIELNADSFNRAIEYYHDLRCPCCGSVKIDTSDILEKERKYKYGCDNTLIKKGVKK